MNHSHFESIESTQEYLKTQEFDPNIDYLVSCESQTKGYGQHSRAWQHYAGNLAFSFTLSPSEVSTLTSLEIGILLVDFFKHQYGINLGLKWPNDIIIHQNQKCGGIIMHNSLSSKRLIIGIGLNTGEISTQTNFKTQAGQIKIEQVNHKDLSAIIYQYILDHRILSPFIIKQWEQYCCHLNSNVSINEGDQSYIGNFIGVNPDGAALVKLDHKKIQTIYSGSLSLLNS